MTERDVTEISKKLPHLAALLALSIAAAGCGDEGDCDPGQKKKEVCDGMTHTLRCGLDGTWPASPCAAPSQDAALGEVKAPAELDYKPESVAVLDKTTGLIWQRKVDKTRRSREEGIAYCIALSLKDPLLGLLEDWRLPSRDELESIVLSSTTNPSIDAQAFPDTPPEPFWTFTKFTDKQGIGVDFETGGTGYQYFSEKFYVRCVH